MLLWRHQKCRFYTCSAAAEQRRSDAALQWRIGVLPRHQRLMMLLLCCRHTSGSTLLHMGCS